MNRCISLSIFPLQVQHRRGGYPLLHPTLAENTGEGGRVDQEQAVTYGVR